MWIPLKKEFEYIINYLKGNDTRTFWKGEETKNYKGNDQDRRFLTLGLERQLSGRFRRRESSSLANFMSIIVVLFVIGIFIMVFTLVASELGKMKLMVNVSESLVDTSQQLKDPTQSTETVDEIDLSEDDIWFFDKFIVIVAIVVLILMIILIVRAMRASEMMGGKYY